EDVSKVDFTDSIPVETFPLIAHNLELNSFFLSDTSNLVRRRGIPREVDAVPNCQRLLTLRHGQVSGPYFFEGALNGNMYADFLENILNQPKRYESLTVLKEEYFLVNRDVDGTAKSPMRALVCRIEISYKCSTTHTEGMECGSSFTQVHLRILGCFPVFEIKLPRSRSVLSHSYWCSQADSMYYTESCFKIDQSWWNTWNIKYRLPFQHIKFSTTMKHRCRTMSFIDASVPQSVGGNRLSWQRISSSQTQFYQRHLRIPVANELLSPWKLVQIPVPISGLLAPLPRRTRVEFPLKGRKGEEYWESTNRHMLWNESQDSMLYKVLFLINRYSLEALVRIKLYGTHTSSTQTHINMAPDKSIRYVNTGRNEEGGVVSIPRSDIGGRSTILKEKWAGDEICAASGRFNIELSKFSHNQSEIGKVLHNYNIQVISIYSQQFLNQKKMSKLEVCGWSHERIKGDVDAEDLSLQLVRKGKAEKMWQRGVRSIGTSSRVCIEGDGSGANGHQHIGISKKQGFLTQFWRCGFREEDLR
ncbi:hypothetical protein C0J52_24167, partial [Blattella germanica]